MYTKGFTLIELLLVVAVISIAAFSATPLYARFYTQNAVENASVQVLSNLRKAQLYSMMGKQNDGWGVNYASNLITIYKGPNFAGRTSAFDEEFSVPAGVTVSSFEVNFAKRTGLPDSTPTITITGGSTSRTVTVNAQGGASR